jgi:hypothetical protein
VAVAATPVGAFSVAVRPVLDPDAGEVQYAHAADANATSPTTPSPSKASRNVIDTPTAAVAALRGAETAAVGGRTWLLSEVRDPDGCGVRGSLEVRAEMFECSGPRESPDYSPRDSGQLLV